jgi:hypothetical protein
MCLYRIPAETVKVASRNIVVYKMLSRGHHKSGAVAESPYRTTPYQRGEIKSVRRFSSYGGYKTFTTRKHDEGDAVYAGLHAYTSLAEAKDNARGWYSPKVVVKCVIPKGTRYILGRYNQVVSLSLEIRQAVWATHTTLKRDFNKQKVK